MLETQVGQMANQATLMHKLRKFPSNTEMNMEHYNAIYLRMAIEEAPSASTEQKMAPLVRIPEKKEDLGSLSITCSIGDRSFNKVLCDSGGEHQLDANAMFKHLKIGTLKPTTMTLQMTDHSHMSPIEIVENVPIKVKDHLVQDIFYLSVPTGLWAVRRGHFKSNSIFLH